MVYENKTQDSANEGILSLVEDGTPSFPCKPSRLLCPNAHVSQEAGCFLGPAAAALSTTRSGPGNTSLDEIREKHRTKRRFRTQRLTWMVFITPLASTAIFPATVFTPCLNWAISGPAGRTPSKPDALPEEERRKVSFSVTEDEGQVDFSGETSSLFSHFMSRFTPFMHCN